MSSFTKCLNGSLFQHKYNYASRSLQRDADAQTQIYKNMELISWLASHGSKARRGVIWGSTEIRASDSVDIVPPDQLQQFIHNIIRSHWTIGQHMTWIKQKAKEWTWNEVAIATTSPPDHNAMEHPRSVSSLVAFRNIIFEQEAQERGKDGLRARTWQCFRDALWVA